MSTMRLVAILPFSLLAISSMLAQVANRPPAMEELLRGAGLNVALERGRPNSSREIHLRWRSGIGPTAALDPASQNLQFVSSIERSDVPPRQRSSELSADQLVIAVIDSAGIVRYSQIIIDPRLIRGEFPDAQGNLHKDVLYRDDVQFSITVPADVDASEVRILSPHWDGGPHLSPTARFRMPEGARR